MFCAGFTANLKAFTFTRLYSRFFFHIPPPVCSSCVCMYLLTTLAFGKHLKNVTEERINHKKREQSFGSVLLHYFQSQYCGAIPQSLQFFWISNFLCTYTLLDSGYVHSGIYIFNIS